MAPRLGEAVYIGAMALALICTAGMIYANVFYIGGGLIPDLGAVFIGGVIWFFGRFVKALLSGGASRENLG
jgi:hypothetical protein